jgi:hypothetical protein
MVEVGEKGQQPVSYVTDLDSFIFISFHIPFDTKLHFVTI